MFTEIIMARYGWDTIKTPAAKSNWWDAFWSRPNAYVVGVKTGLEKAFVCVRQAADDEGSKMASPVGRSILHATLKAVWKRWTTSREAQSDE